MLKYMLPRTCEHIENIMSHSRSTILTDHQGDAELTWNLTIFSELVRARGGTLLIYKPIIMSVFSRCIRIIHKESYEAIDKAAKHLLQSLSDPYPIDNPSCTDILPIRVSFSEYMTSISLSYY